MTWEWTCRRCGRVYLRHCVGDRRAECQHEHHAPDECVCGSCRTGWTEPPAVPLAARAEARTLTAKLLTREPTGERARIRCGIGHIVTADVFTATYQHTDMDGEPMTPWTMEAYEPPTCVVCGLKLWARV